MNKLTLRDFHRRQLKKSPRRKQEGKIEKNRLGCFQMGVTSTVLLILGILTLIEGSMILLAPKFSMKIGKSFLRFLSKFTKPKTLRKWGIGEVIVAIILIILGLTL